MPICTRIHGRFRCLVSGPLSGRRALHGGSERARGEDELRPRASVSAISPRSTIRSPSRSQPDERERYSYPQVRVIPPGGPYFKWPWERVHKVSIATETMNMAFDPEDPQRQQSGTRLEAVTKDQLNTGLTGQIRYRVSERNLYAYLFGVQEPDRARHGLLRLVLRERIANFEAPPDAPAAPSPTPATVHGHLDQRSAQESLRDLNEHMDRECRSSAARYGIVLDASLITGIDPPPKSNRRSPRSTPRTTRSRPTSAWRRPRRPEDRAVAARGGDRNAQGAGRGRAAARARRAAERLEEQRPGALEAYRAQRAAWLFSKASAGHSWRHENDELPASPRRSPSSGSSSSCRSSSARARCSASTPSSRSARCHVYVLFGKVRRPYSTNRASTFSGREARARGRSIVNWLGKRYVLDLRLDQEYLRSQPVNSEEGAPMGIGIWYEMFVSDPVAYLFKNTDPRGSLARQRQQRHGALPEQHAARPTCSRTATP